MLKSKVVPPKRGKWLNTTRKSSKWLKYQPLSKHSLSKGAQLAQSFSQIQKSPPCKESGLISWKTQILSPFNEKHVSARGCKHCHCLTFQWGVAYAEKQSKAKEISFDHPLPCSSSSKGANGSSLNIEMWRQMQTHLDLSDFFNYLDFKNRVY
jgi:hypothetical protein